MTIYLSGDVVVWAHPDDTFKEHEEYRDDENCVTTNGVTYGESPNDGYEYQLTYNRAQNEFSWCKLGKRPDDLKLIIPIIHSNTEATASDNLLNMELSTDTNTKVESVESDSILIMELLMAMDEKLDLILNPK
ncbi:hypothetical protein PBV87_00950 [Niameybacter massiliensis]|uniref:Uncharacterized protein n=1 Tax=Holtiella tumoricola TaxID=3018743 RepID=A0AA42IZ25_9FIRM|nr:hypothetical protein [Holtiella tumoricola]MDA3730081.1 hypothetical protein [Holtiella tumoricola]